MKIINTIFVTLLTLMIQVNYIMAMGGQPGQPGKPGQGQGGGLSGMLMLFLPLLLIWWLLLIRPQQKREKDRKQMLNQLKKGENIITIGGIHGQVVQVKDDRVTIKVADKTNIEVSKAAISGKPKTK